MSQSSAKPIIFLSHNSEDKPDVREIGQRLERDHGIDPWLDEWNLVPGDPLLPAIERALRDCDGVVVFVGSSVGPHQNAEMQIAIERQLNAKERFPVIPVLLPGVSRMDDDDIPAFLKNYLWVEFADLEDADALRRLVAGVFGEKPGISTDQSSASKNNPAKSRPHNRIEQERLAIDNDEVFADRLRHRLADALARDELQDFVAKLNQDAGSRSPEVAARRLANMDPPKKALEKMLEVCRTLHRSDVDALWYLIQEPYLLLMQRLVDPAWISAQSERDREKDLRFFEVLIPTSTPSLGIEVIMARLDSQRGGVLFEAQTLRPANQINTYDDSVRKNPAPSAQIAVEQLGQYLMAKFEREVPEQMSSRHWEELDQQLLWRAGSRKHAYYLVVPESDLHYAKPDVLGLLYKNLPNLPRFLLMTEGKQHSPLNCKPFEVDAAIEAFWDLKPDHANDTSR